MTSKERTRTALTGGTPDRVPVLPQICPPHAIRVSGKPFRETIVDRLINPGDYDLSVAQCARMYGVDGFRVWLGSEPADILWNEADDFARNPATGEPVGHIDFKGGGGILRLPQNRRSLDDKDIE